MRTRRALTLVGASRFVEHCGLADGHLAEAVEESRAVLEAFDIDDHRASMGIVTVEAQIFVELDVAFVADADEAAEAGMAVLLALGEEVDRHVARLAQRPEHACIDTRPSHQI